MTSLVSASNSLQALGRRGAVASAAAVGLVSLLHGAPVRIASLRGGLTLIAALLLLRLGHGLVLHSMKVDRTRAQEVAAD